MTTFTVNERYLRTRFKSLQVGDVFLSESCLFVKISDHPDLLNAIMVGGRHRKIDLDTSVVPVSNLEVQF